MARKTNDLDDWDLGTGDDFGWDDDISSTPIKDDRSVVTKTGSAALSGVRQELTDPANVRRYITQSLPKQYGEAFDVIDDATYRAGSLYDKAARTIRPQIRETKRALRAIMPRYSALLPETIRKKVNGLLADEESAFKNGVDTGPEAEMKAEMAKIFSVQAEQTALENETKRGEERIRDMKSQDRFNDIFSVVSAIQEDINHTTAYQDQVTSKYQQKSLELQFRHFFVARDLFEVTKAQAADSKSALDAIVKNTAMPEFIKLTTHEAAKQMMRDKLIGKVSDTAGSFLRNYASRVAKQVGVKLGEIAEGVKSGLEMTEQVAQMAEMDAEISGMSGSEYSMNDLFNTLAKFGGQQVAAHYTGKIAGKAREKLGKNDKVRNGGYWLTNLFNTGAEKLNRFTNEGSDLDDKHYWAKELARAFLPGHTGHKISVDTDGLEKSRDPAVFDNQTRLSIVEIIPGWLGKIFQSIEKVRTGRDDVEEQTYNYDRHLFQNKSELQSEMKEKIFGKQDSKYRAQQIYDFVNNTLDPEQQMTQGARQALVKQLMKDAYRAEGFSPNSIISGKGLGSDISPEIKVELKDFFKNLYEVDDKNKVGLNQQEKLSKHFKEFSSYSRGTAELNSGVNLWANAGYREQLRGLGILKNDGGYDYADSDYGNKRIMEDVSALFGEAAKVIEQAAASEEEKTKQEEKKEEGLVTRIINKISDRLSGPRGGMGQGGFIGARNGPLGQQAQRGSQLPPPPSHPHESQQISTNSTERIVQAIEKYGQGTIDAVTITDVHDSVNDTNSILRSLVKLLDKKILEAEPDPNKKTGKGWFRSGIGSIWSGLGKYTGGVLGGTGSVIGGAGRMVGGLMTGIGNLLSGESQVDLCLPGEKEPRLKAFKMKLGHYVDAADPRRVIKKLSDIRGGVIDITLQEKSLVLTDEEFRNAKQFFTSTGKSLAKTLFGLPGKLIRGYGSMVGNLAMMPIDAANWALKQVKQTLVGAVDVWIKGENAPRLLGILFKAGRYVSGRTMKPLKSHRDFDGPVLDAKDNFKVLIREEEMKDICADRTGTPLPDLMGKVKKLVSGAVDLMLAPVKLMSKVAMGGFNRLGGWVDRKLATEPDLDEAEQGSNAVKYLSRIYSLLKKKMPSYDGEQGRSTGEVVAGTLRSAKESSSEAYAKMMGKISAQYDKTVGYNEEEGGSRKEALLDFLRTAKTNAGVVAKGTKKKLLKRIEDGINSGEEWAQNLDEGLVKEILVGKVSIESLKKAALADSSKISGFVSGKAQEGMEALGKTKIGNLALTRGAGLKQGAQKKLTGWLDKGIEWANTLPDGFAKDMLIGNMPLTDSIHQLGADLRESISEMVDRMVGKVKGVKPGEEPGEGQTGESESSVFDRDGDGDRDGSWQDQAQKKEEKKKNSLWEKFLSREGGGGKDDKEEKERKGIFSMLSGFFGPGSMLAKGIGLFSNAAKLIWNAGKWFTKLGPIAKILTKLGSILSLIPGLGFLGGGAAAATAGTAATVAAGTAATAATVAGGTALAGGAIAAGGTAATVAGGALAAEAAVATTAAATAGTGLGVGGALAGIGTVIAGFFTAPVWLTIGAIAAVGAIGYGIYRWARSSFDPLEKVRLTQYGVKLGETDDSCAVLELEEYLQDKVRFTDRGPTLQERLDLPEMLKMFELEPTSQGVDQWMEWFQRRFKPVFLTHLSVLSKLAPGAKLSDADDKLDEELFMEYVQKTKFAPNTNGYPYNVIASPFPGRPSVTGTKEIDIAIDEVVKEYLKYDERRKRRESQSGSSAKTVSAGDYYSSEYDKSRNDPAVDKPKLPKYYDVTTKGADWVQQQGPLGSQVNTLFQNVGMTPANGGAPMAPGAPVVHPGNGTGGDINLLPMPMGGGYEVVKDLIIKASQMTGVDPGLMVTMAGIESSYEPYAKAGTSSATGLYQFINSTWEEMLMKYGSKYGIAPGTPRTDPRANALMGAEFLKQNQKYLESALGRGVSETDLYMAHFLGAGGAAQFLKAGASSIAAQVLPKAASANRGIFYNGGNPRTVAEVYALMDEKVSKFRNKYGSDARAAAGVPQPAANDATVNPTASSSVPSMLAKPADTNTKTPSTLSSGFDLANKPTGVPGLSDTKASSTSSAPASIALPSTSTAVAKAAEQDTAVAAAQMEKDKQSRATQASQEARINTDQKLSQSLNDLMIKSVDIQGDMASTLRDIAKKIDGIALKNSGEAKPLAESGTKSTPVNMAKPQKAALSPISLKREKRA